MKKLNIQTLNKKDHFDSDSIILHAVMQIVVDFVEIECSFMEVDAPYTLKDWLWLKLPRWLRSDNLIRSRERGLQHLNSMESCYTSVGLTVPNGPEVIRDVYIWWKDLRSARPNPDEVAGLNAFFELPVEQRDETLLMPMILKAEKLENKYYDEDTKMMQKVLKVRGFLWT